MKGNSKMGRGCLLAEFYLQIKQIGNKKEVTERLYPFYVATSQFESYDRTDYLINRKLQCEDVFDRLLKDEPNAIVLSDFGFDNDAEYKNNIRCHNYVDIVMEKFDALIGQEEQFSFTVHGTPHSKPSRPDKICTPVVNSDVISAQ